MQLLVDQDKLSASGRDFLVAALDPMHDNQLKELAGWPDVETASSVVRCIKQTQSVSGIAGAGNWDFSLNLFPFLNSVPGRVYGRRNDLLSPVSGATNHAMGGLAGYRLTPGQALDIGAQDPIVQLCLDDTYSAGAGRVVGLGIEVVNTTSPLNKQGQVTVWRQPNATHIAETLLRPYAGPGLTSDVPTCAAEFIEAFPSSVPQAMLIPGSRQWEAADGAYVIGTFVGQDNPPLLVSYKQPAMFVSTAAVDKTFSTPLSSSPATTFNSGLVMMPYPEFSNVNEYANTPAMKIYPLHQSGAFFQGLSEQTTLAITLNVFVETFPTVAEADILVLATPSAEYDPVALQIFSHALTQLPVGVPANWNPWGEWFSDIVETVSDWTTPMLTVAHPGLGAGMAAAGKLAKEYRRRNGYQTAEQRAQSANAKRKNRQLAPPTPKTKPALPPKDANYRKTAAQLKGGKRK